MNILANIDNTTAQQGWHASLELGFRKKHRTVVSHVRHTGPLRIQRAFYPEDNGTCHVYLLHPPGGVVGGDRLDINIEAQPGSETLVTTPAANKFYRSHQTYARQHQQITLNKDATFEWLPQETIVFNSAHARATTRIDLEDDSRFIGWDIICLGRPAAGESFTDGHYRQHIEVWRKQDPLLIDRGNFTGGGEMLQAQWGMAGYTVNGIMVATADDTNLVNKIRQNVIQADNRFSVSAMSGLIVCRYLGHHAEEAKSLFITAWQQLRPSVCRKQACLPRIWKT